MPYVNHRWLGGLLTNWRTISSRIERLHELRRLNEEGQIELLPAKERITMLGELEKLEANLGGVADMRKEQLAVREARRLGLPVVALVDTNCDPDEADFVIPGNDDAIRSCSLVIRAIADGIAAGQAGATAEEFARPSANGDGAAAEVAASEPEPVADDVAEAPEHEVLSQGEETVEPAEPVAAEQREEPVAAEQREEPVAAEQREEPVAAEQPEEP